MSKVDNKLKFPVSYEMRVIMETIENDEINIKAIQTVLEQLRIPHRNWNHRRSSEAKYTSYSVTVMVRNHDTLKNLYTELNKIPGVKHAI
ncbi:MAG: DUF493 domain-containing protein [Spirochaetales bacterium]|nr:DUF493 domain-containing protein [Spirochaetales bacterium]